MARVNYSEEQINEYCETAAEMGVGPAMRALGYPASHHTATKWLTERGIEITVDTLRQKAALLKVHYGAQEKYAAAATLLDRYIETIEQDTLTPEELNKLANGLQKVIQTMNLIDGQATDRRESVTADRTDLEISKLVKEMKEKNDQEVVKIKDMDKTE